MNGDAAPSQEPSWPNRATLLGTPLSLTSYDEVLQLIDDRPADRASVFFFCNVHAVMTARRDPALATALQHADVTTPDGMPLVWALRRLADPNQGRVYGPDLMEAALSHGVGRGWRHFFLGSSPDTLSRLEASSLRRCPDLIVAGTHSPPFRPLTTDEEEDIIAMVLGAATDVLWVGMGLPKQELLIERLRGNLPGVAVLGVGAAFDFLAGTVSQAPDWMQDRGLEWLYRLWREPRRLWRRYLWNNPAYLFLMARQLLTSRSR